MSIAECRVHADAEHSRVPAVLEVSAAGAASVLAALAAGRVPDALLLAAAHVERDDRLPEPLLVRVLYHALDSGSPPADRRRAASLVARSCVERPERPDRMPADVAASAPLRAAARQLITDPAVDSTATSPLSPR